MIAFGMPKQIVTDNEKALNSAAIKFLLQEQLQAKVYTTPPYTSTSNGQVERFHSTLTEIMRCLKLDESTLEFEELLFKAVEEYNTSVHSTTQK
jgi:serine/threonine-protein phosphatase PP1 catalytic subunit